MIVLRTLEDLNLFVSKIKQTGKTIGFVPTMGFLHSGHISLIHLSRKKTEVTIASIYVNPSQFNDSNDFEKYPKNEKNDLALLEQNSCDAVFIPTRLEIESLKKVSVDLGDLDNVMEGRFRPGHFKGVVEVVYRLFSVVKPDKAFFGVKDFQQLLVIQKMVSDTKLPIDILGAPVVRESNGLAMSSRNSRLSFEAREKAGFIFEILNSFGQVKRSVLENRLQCYGFELEYLETHCFGNQNRLFIAGVYDGVRLIDNIKIK